MEILIIILCIPFYVINSFCDKYISAQGENVCNTKYNVLKFSIGSLLLLPLYIFDAAPKLQWGAILCGVGCGCFYVINKTVILKGYEKTSVAFMTFCHAAGMLIPCFFGYFVWAESMGIWSLIGVGLTIASIVFVKEQGVDKKRIEWQGIVYGLLVFLASGGVMVLQKLMGKYFATQSLIEYNFISFLFSAFVLGGFLPFDKRKRDEDALGQISAKKMLPFAFGSAFSLCSISLAMTVLASSVPSVILFPLFNGSGILFVCVGSIFVFKEKMSKKQVIGLLIGVLGLCFINIK